MYSSQQLIDGIKAGSITIDLGGHRFNGGAERILQHTIEKMEWLHSHNAEKSNSQEEKTAMFGSKYLKAMESEAYIKLGNFLPFSIDVDCCVCGEICLRVLLKKEDLLGMGTYKGEIPNVSVVESVCVFKEGVRPLVTKDVR